MTISALSAVPDPLELWCFSQYGRVAPALASRAANNLAWRLLLRGAPQEAIGYADLAVAYAGWDADAARETRVRVLLALGREEEAHESIQSVLARNPGSTLFRELAASARYRAWMLGLHALRVDAST